MPEEGPNWWTEYTYIGEKLTERRFWESRHGDPHIGVRSAVFIGGFASHRFRYPLTRPIRAGLRECCKGRVDHDRAVVPVLSVRSCCHLANKFE